MAKVTLVSQSSPAALLEAIEALEVHESGLASSFGQLELSTEVQGNSFRITLPAPGRGNPIRLVCNGTVGIVDSRTVLSADFRLARDWLWVPLGIAAFALALTWWSEGLPTRLLDYWPFAGIALGFLALSGLVAAFSQGRLGDEKEQVIALLRRLAQRGIEPVGA